MSQTDISSGIKAQYVGLDGLKMKSCWSLRKMARSDATMTYPEILPSSPWVM